MKEFKNIATENIVGFYDFIMMALDKAEREYEERQPQQLWCNLTKGEQVYFFCKAYQELEILWKEINF